MTRFGGNTFTSISVPLALPNRYFVLEPGSPPKVTVVVREDSQFHCEILRNSPAANPFTDITRTGNNFITVADKAGIFIYKVRPASVTSVVFGNLHDGGTTVRITDRWIEIGTNKFENNTFLGPMVGISVDSNGAISVGSPIPSELITWLCATAQDS